MLGNLVDGECASSYGPGVQEDIKIRPSARVVLLLLLSPLIMIMAGPVMALLLMALLLAPLVGTPSALLLSVSPEHPEPRKIRQFRDDGSATGF